MHASWSARRKSRTLCFPTTWQIQHNINFKTIHSITIFVLQHQWARYLSLPPYKVSQTVSLSLFCLPSSFPVVSIEVLRAFPFILFARVQKNVFLAMFFDAVAYQLLAKPSKIEQFVSYYKTPNRLLMLFDCNNENGRNALALWIGTAGNIIIPQWFFFLLHSNSMLLA